MGTFLWMVCGSFLCEASDATGHATEVAQLTEDGKADIVEEPTIGPVFVLGDGSQSRYGYRIPSIVTTRRGTLLAFAERRLGLGDHAENDIVLRRSEDHGKTWSDLIVVHEDGAKSLNNPCAVVLPDTGRVLLMYQSFPADRHSRAIGKHIGRADPGIAGDKVVKTLLQSSDDDGKTWSTPRDVTAGAKRAERIVANATGPGIGIVLGKGERRGRILMPQNESWYDGDARHFNVYAAYSDDGGASWYLGEPAPYAEMQAGEGNEVQMVELSDGSVMLNTRTVQGSRVRKVGISRDGGITWTPLVDDPQLIEPQCMGSIIRAKWPGKDGRNALLFSCPGSKKGRQNGTIYASFDDGKTWPVSRVLESGGFAYSCLVQMSDGSLGCLYEATKYKQIVFARFSFEWLRNHQSGKQKH